MKRAAVAAILAALATPAAAALSDEIQVYADDINAPGEFGLELHANTTARGRGAPDYPGEVVPNHGTRLTPEFSYGLDRTWEAGLYLPTAFDSRGRGDLAGVKLRMKWLPVKGPEEAGGPFAGANLEISRVKGKYDESVTGAELRVMLGQRTPEWLVAVNPVFEWALAPGYRRGTPDFSLGVKASHRVAEKVSAGLEYYSGLGALDHVVSLSRQSNTLFGTLDFAWKGWGFNVGIGRGLTGSADAWTVKAIFEIPVS